MSTETGYLASDLSNQKFRYDLIVGTTAEAINQTLKMYLFKKAPAPKELWYGQAEAGGEVKPMDPIKGIDPFSIASGAEPPKALLDSDFVFAIKAGFGLPEGVAPLDVPDILILGTDSQKVHYNMFFNTFQICTLDWGRHGSYAWNNYEQPSGSPYIFTYQVDMNFDPADPNDQFSDLPEKVRNQLLNYNADTMFSVQQLYLDLNNAGLQSMPQISGIPSTSHVYVVLQEDFINTYWQSMQQAGKFMLGYAVHTNSQPTSHASLQPTSLNFMTVPHYEADGSISTNNKLYTLNYLMDTNNRKLTVGGPFTWNWVKSNEVNSYHGAMAVRREVFANYLINAMSPYLFYIALTPTTSVHINPPGLSGKIGGSITGATNQHFTYVDAPGAKIADYSFTGSSHHEDQWALTYGKYNLDSTAGATISISGNEITVTLEAQLNIDLVWDLGTANIKGRVGGYSNTAVFIVSVDAGGKVTVTDKPGYPKPKIIGADVSKGLFAGIDGTSAIESTMESGFKKMTAFMNNFSKDVENYLNSTGGKWIFPGGQTFLFKDAVFSKNQDFVTHITYADPA